VKKVLGIVPILVIVSSAAAFAQSYSVTYSDGAVEIKTSEGWSDLSIGDPVAATASVRVSQNGSLELARGSARITILKDGTYDIASLARAAQRSGAAGAGAEIAQKLQSLTTDRPRTTTAAGVRAEEQGSQPAVTWADESDEVRSEVASLLAEKKYLEAVKELQKALDESPSPTDEQELTYLEGVAFYGAGQRVRAFKALSRVSADPGVPWYPRYVLLKAQLLVDSLDFPGALDILQRFVSANPSGEQAQLAWLLTYYCKRGLGDAEAARAALEAGYQLDPSSETAKLIDQQRKTQ
jgi:tetratricopeptide (TPR) repeat protein